MIRLEFLKHSCTVDHFRELWITEYKWGKDKVTIYKNDGDTAWAKNYVVELNGVEVIHLNGVEYNVLQRRDSTDVIEKLLNVLDSTTINGIFTVEDAGEIYMNVGDDGKKLTSKSIDIVVDRIIKLQKTKSYLAANSKKLFADSLIKFKKIPIIVTLIYISGLLICLLMAYIFPFIR